LSLQNRHIAIKEPIVGRHRKGQRWPRRDLNPHVRKGQGILNPLRLPIPPLGLANLGGDFMQPAQSTAVTTVAFLSKSPVFNVSSRLKISRGDFPRQVYTTPGPRFRSSPSKSGKSGKFLRVRKPCGFFIPGDGDYFRTLFPASP
jgi:hypothetical protein